MPQTRASGTRPNLQPVVIVNLVTLGRKARRFLIADLDTVLTPEGDE